MLVHLSTWHIRPLLSKLWTRALEIFFLLKKKILTKKINKKSYRIEHVQGNEHSPRTIKAQKDHFFLISSKYLKIYKRNGFKKKYLKCFLRSKEKKELFFFIDLCLLFFLFFCCCENLKNEKIFYLLKKFN